MKSLFKDTENRINGRHLEIFRRYSYFSRNNHFLLRVKVPFLVPWLPLDLPVAAKGAPAPLDSGQCYFYMSLPVLS